MSGGLSEITGLRKKEEERDQEKPCVDKATLEKKIRKKKN